MRAWRQPSPFGEVTVVVSEHGVREISLPGDDQPDVELGRADRETKRELDDWFKGRRHAFDLALDLEGIDGFRRTVLETLVKEVGWGETVSYGELAAMAGRPPGGTGRGKRDAQQPDPVRDPVPPRRSRPGARSAATAAAATRSS